MKNIINIIASLVVALIMPLSALAENTPPAIPVMLYGSVTIDGNVAPAGTDVAAKYGNRTESFKLTVAGKYSINIPVNAMTVEFKVNGKDAGQVAISNVPSIKYDLAVVTQNNSGGGGGGNGGGNNGGNNGGNSNPATPAIPADPKNDIPATPATNQYGQVKGATDVNIADGDIIQCRNSANPDAVYIVKIVNGKKYIRHIVSLQIFNHYKHLKWENLRQVESLDGFSLSGWVRVNTGANGNPGPSDKVYEINGDQTRHWIDMTAEQFLQHGGSEEAIFNINQGELNLYKEGPAVKLL